MPGKKKNEGQEPEPNENPEPNDDNGDDEGDDDNEAQQTQGPGDDEDEDDDGDEDSEPAPSRTTRNTPQDREVQRVVPATAVAQIRAKERAKGRRLALKELDEQAQTKGYLNWNDLVEKAQPKGAPVTDRKEISRLRRSENDLLEERRTLNQKLSKAEKANADLQRKLQDQNTRFELTMLAREHGVTDPDYAVELYRRQASKKSDDELKKFQPKDFFKTLLRESHPHLYTVRTKPADTSPSNEEPKPSDKGGEGGAPKPPVDAKKMSREEFEAHLRSRGLNVGVN